VRLDASITPAAERTRPLIIDESAIAPATGAVFYEAVKETFKPHELKDWSETYMAAQAQEYKMIQI
jgi:hypothetical protein